MAVFELAATDALRIINLMFGVFLSFAELVLLVRRFSQIRLAGNKEAKFSILSISSVSIIVFGLCTCMSVIASTAMSMEHLSDPQRACDLGMKMAFAAYCGMRFSVYVFLVWRIDIVSVIPSGTRFVRIVKWMVIIFYPSGVVIALHFAQGNLVEGEVTACRGMFNPLSIFFGALMDFIICFVALIFFLRPLKKASDKAGQDQLGRLLKKMRFYGCVMILSTVLALCLAAVIGGLSLIYALDAGVTSAALVLLYERNDFFLKKTFSVEEVKSGELRRVFNNFAKSGDMSGTYHFVWRDSLETSRIQRLEEEVMAGWVTESGSPNSLGPQKWCSAVSRSRSPESIKETNSLLDLELRHRISTNSLQVIRKVMLMKTPEIVDVDCRDQKAPEYNSLSVIVERRGDQQAFGDDNRDLKIPGERRQGNTIKRFGDCEIQFETVPKDKGSWR